MSNINIVTRGLAALAFLTLSLTASASDKDSTSYAWHNRLHVGGYGEVAMSRNFYSDNYLRYSEPERYKNSSSHGRFDLL